MSFADDRLTRTAEVYADFLLPHLDPSTRLLDCGCGSGSITVGLAERVASIVGIDRTYAETRDAQTYKRSSGSPRLHFVGGDGTRLPFAPASFDAALIHSALEAADDPLALLRDVRRVVVPGGVVGAASVEYSGLILDGPEIDRLRHFYALRETLWVRDGEARPRAGQTLRALFHEAGFVDVSAHARFLSYGAEDTVRTFGENRAAECEPGTWFATRCEAHGLASPEEVRELGAAWRAWSRAPSAFCAFAWCRAVGRNP